MGHSKIFITQVMTLALMVSSWSVQAEAEQEIWSYKFAPSYYNNNNQQQAWDMNLRGNYGKHTVWIGHYVQGEDGSTEKFQQTRAGYENAMSMPFGMLVPSVQVATSGFVGGSLTAQVGSLDQYALIGVGRTNLQTYYNLNFDPNDAITVGYARRLPDRSMLTAYYLWDDRLSTSQEVAHMVWRKWINDTQRLTIDMAVKKGRPAAGEAMVNGHIVSIGLDHDQLFFKLALDQKVNFSDMNQIRAVAGVRF